MTKRFKSIVVAFMTVAMLLTFYVPAMAAEPVANEISSQAVDTANSARALVGEFHYTGRLSANKYLGSVQVTSTAKTVRWTVGRTGGSGLVNIEFTNVDTGETRTISAVANNTLDSLTWVGGGLPAGRYYVTVIYTSAYSIYDVDLYFYN
ncbi:MAG: hypothetical protein HFJ26_10080 [Clostridia bacterium]|jgi:hypothetical protein|nr:hypothetical protein [Clostridia bacterium]MCI9001192.1 hypothetical protein [Clostridia bacterium]